MALVNKHYQTDSFDETLTLAASFGKSLPTGSVVLFYGDLGAGKTTFIKGLAEGACGIKPDEVVSPTFSLLNIYKGTKSLFHFDLYRMKGAQDFMELGFHEYLKSEEGITCIEWSEKIEELLPDHHYKVQIQHKSDDKRLITISEGV